MTATIGLVLDCTDPTELARFWSEALGYTTLGGAGNYVMLVDPDSVRPKLLLQAVPEAKAVKNRMHLDIETPDVEDVPAVGEVVGDQQGDDGRQRLLTQSGQGDRPWRARHRSGNRRLRLGRHARWQGDQRRPVRRAAARRARPVDRRTVGRSPSDGAALGPR